MVSESNEEVYKEFSHNEIQIKFIIFIFNSKHNKGKLHEREILVNNE